MSKQRLLILTGVFFLMATFGVLLTAPMVVQAIGEITPTPVEDQATPVPTIAPTPVPTVAPSDNSDDSTSEVDALFDDATAAFQSGDFDGAIDFMNQVLDIEPDNAEALTIRGLARSQIGSLQLAIDDYTFALELVPYRWDILTFRGDAFAELQDYEEANADFLRALSYNPRYTEAYFALAGLADSRGRTEELELYRILATGMLAFERGNVPDTISAMTDALTLDNTSQMAAYAYYNRALSFHSLQDYESAIEDYSAALDIDPELHDAYLGRGIAYRMTDDIEAAGSDFVHRIEILENESVTQAIEFDQPIDVAMTYGAVYRLTFVGISGNTVTILAAGEANTGVDPLIALVGPNGDALAGDDDFGGGTFALDSEIRSFALPEDGEYTILVSHANGGFDGNVRVTLTCDMDVCSN
ncbi:MAG: tetratricopeptide repeat protein [Anaerolineae bacterium]|nr:tetratricopeptide repeat protein [Anaerolineae bacterium]